VNREAKINAPPMRFVTHRPRYTSGFAVADFPAIQAVLYADTDCELYLLDEAAGKSLLLIVARAGDGAPTADQRREWLERHGCSVLACPAMSSSAQHFVVRVYGSWMAKIPAHPMTEQELYGLLIALIDLSTDAANAGLTSVPIRPLLWIEGPLDVQRLSSVYVRGADGHEATVVHQIGQTFLWAASGISSIEMESTPDEGRLMSWCQNADPGLAHVLSRCIDTTQAITTLHELRREVASSLLRLAVTRPSVELTANQYINVSPYRYLWRTRSRPSMR
jgi:hypothetical protein